MLTILIGWMILKVPGVEEIVIGSAWTTLSFLAELEKDLGAAVGENFTVGKVWNGVVARVVS